MVYVFDSKKIVHTLILHKSPRFFYIKQLLRYKKAKIVVTLTIN